MDQEAKHPSDIPSRLALEIEFGLGGVLDRYAEFQEVFFDACRQYTTNFSSGSYERIEVTALSLEFKLADTIHAIAAHHETSAAKLRMAHGFMVADDAMRTALFRELVPGHTFLAYGEGPDSGHFHRNIPSTLVRANEANLLASLSKTAVTFLRHDVERFGEAVAIA